MILRDRDNDDATTASPLAGWAAAADATLDERLFYCQNWRADVVALTKSDGTPVEYVPDRVSTDDQHTHRQLEGMALDRVFTHRASGKNTDRPGRPPHRSVRVPDPSRTGFLEV